MALRNDICAACIPFSLGSAIAALLPVALAAPVAALSLSLSVLLLIFFHDNVRREALVLASLLFAGICCHCASHLFPAPVWQGSGAAARAMDGICNLIDTMDFKSGDNRALVKALVTGRKDDLPRSVVEAFRDSGTAHILALSGMHLCVLYGMLAFVLRWAGASRPVVAVRSALSVALCFTYCAMAGSGESLVRACLFVLINELARNLPGRRRKGINVFCAALFIQLFLDPQAIRSVGFQLSYLSVLAILTLHPRIDALFPAEESRLLKKVWSAASLSISCQLFTAPAVLFYFGTFPRHFLISNLVGVPLSSALMIIAALSIVLSAVGLCPDILVRLCEFCASALILCMESVS